MKSYELVELNAARLRVRETAEPRPGPGEAVIRIRAASLNFLDAAVATGRYPGAKLPLVPIADGAGEVVEIGEDVRTVGPGDRVAIHPKAEWVAGAGTTRNVVPMRGVNLPGALTEFACVQAETLVRAPDHLSWEQIATLPVAATTAWNALDRAGIGPGRVVTLLGTGGVSVFALQLAKARGASVVMTSSSDEKLERAAGLGADHLVNYRRTPDWEREVLSITDGRGADLVLEGSGTDTFPRSLQAVRHGGMVFVIGFLTGTRTELDLIRIIDGEIRVQGSNTGPVMLLADAVAAIGAHRLEPVIDTTYAIADLAAAYTETVGASGSFGKRAVRL